MRNIITLILAVAALLSASSCTGDRGRSTDDLGGLYARLDSVIDRSDIYEQAREERINSIKRNLRQASDPARRFELTNRIIEEYNAFNADSALAYISQNLRNLHATTAPGEYTRLLIRRGDVYAHAGLFPDALATMSSIPRDSLTQPLLEPYYTTYCALYQYLYEYNTDHETAVEYEHQRTLYADSLSRVISPGTFGYLTHVVAEKARTGNFDEAIEELSTRLADYEIGTREYSILASTLAHIYEQAGRPDDYRKYLVLSAISDTQGAVKENMSFRALSTVMFEAGDVERANRYLKKSISDANYYSAIMRNAQSSKMLPLIDEAYIAVQTHLNSRLRTMVGVCCILLVILAITLIFILRQVNKVRRANDEATQANARLSRMSGRLRDANAELKQRNAELHEFNRIKEQYAGLFMESCSSAISALKHYQQTLRNLAQGGKEAALLRRLQSTEVTDMLLKDFYARFDEAILSIYPQFVSRFNSLLRPDGQVTLKPGELLSTELRLFALIRLGIDDNSTIAEFLRCSLSTVYTYRSKMKKRAINPETFDSDVRNRV